MEDDRETNYWERLRVQSEMMGGIDEQEQECVSEWDRESVVSMESGVGEKGQDEEERERVRWEKKMEEQARYEKKMEEQVRNKKKAEEEKIKKGREQEKKEEEEETKRQREEDASFELKIKKIKKGLKDITGAVSREDVKSKLAFGRTEQQIVKNAVIDLLDGLVGLTVDQMKIEGKAREWEGKYRKLEKEWEIRENLGKEAGRNGEEN